MAFNLSEERPASGLLITHNENDKFRTETIIVRFIVPIEEIRSQSYIVLNTLLSESSSVYPDKQELIRQLTRLYGATLTRFGYSSGNMQIIGFNMTCIADRFAYDNEEVNLNCAQILLDCLLSPNITNGKFNENYFETVKHDLFAKIKSQINNRHLYAVRRANAIAFEGEPGAVDLLGNLEQAEALTNEDVVRCYYELLDKAFISVSFCGGGSNKKAQKLVTERLTALAKSRTYKGEELHKLLVPAVFKEQKNITERVEQAQTKLILIYKFDYDDEFAIKLAVSLFGGTPFSKLFVNVREKLSLCYYCHSSIMSGKNAVIVDCGVGDGNENKARDEIIKQLNDLQNGIFSDEELVNTKRSYIGNLRSVYDFSDDLNAWFFRRFESGDRLTPQEAIEKVEAVTRERVIAAANALKLDTIYVLGCEETKEVKDDE